MLNLRTMYRLRRLINVMLPVLATQLSNHWHELFWTLQCLVMLVQNNSLVRLSVEAL